ncbi:MAG: hypothetical protein ACFBZ8_06720 [Opitutales bacterium]
MNRCCFKLCASALCGLLLAYAPSQGQETAPGNEEGFAIAEVLRIAQANVRERGGLQRLLALNSVRVRGTLRQGEATVTLTVFKRRPNRLRVEAEARGQVTFVTYDGRTGWRWTSEADAKPQAMTGLERQLLRLQARFANSLDELDPSRVEDFRAVPRTDGEGVEFYRLRLGLPGGGYEEIFLDGETFLEQRVDLYAMRDEMPLTTLYSDYKDIDGYQVAHRVVSTHDGETLSELVIEDVRFNLGVIPSMFAPPRAQD